MACKCPVCRHVPCGATTPVPLLFDDDAGQRYWAYLEHIQSATVQTLHAVIRGERRTFDGIVPLTRALWESHRDEPCEYYDHAIQATWTVGGDDGEPFADFVRNHPSLHSRRVKALAFEQMNVKSWPVVSKCYGKDPMDVDVNRVPSTSMLPPPPMSPAATAGPSMPPPWQGEDEHRRNVGRRGGGRGGRRQGGGASRNNGARPVRRRTDRDDSPPPSDAEVLFESDEETTDRPDLAYDAKLLGNNAEVLRILRDVPKWDEEAVEELICHGATPLLLETKNRLIPTRCLPLVDCTFVQPSGRLVKDVRIGLAALHHSYKNQVAHLMKAHKQSLSQA